MSFPSTEPRVADSDNNLLFKICQELSNQNGGVHPPQLGDSNNNLLFKIAHLVILDGTGDVACTAALATCNLLTASQAAQLAANVITIAALNAQIAANPQDMQVEWTPTSQKLGEKFGYTNNLVDFPGITSINFKGATSLAGFIVSNQTTLTSLLFSNLTSALLLESSSDSVLTSVSAPLLVTLSSTGVSLTVTSNPLLTSVNFPALQSIAGSVSISSNITLTSLNLNSFVSTGSTTSFTGNNALVSVSFPVFTTVGGTNRTMSFSSSALLQSINLPSLATISGGFTAATCPALTTISFPNYLPTNTKVITATGCALSAATVNHILARAIANAAYVSGTINTSGGTSSAPTGQGIADKAALILRGVTVTTN